MRFVLFAILIDFLISCVPDKNEPVDISMLKFHTTDASEMFFKNLRQSDYDVENKSDAGINVYRHKKLFNSDVELKPSLVHNWRTDNAYLIFDKLDYDQILVIIENDTIPFELTNHSNHAQLALTIYNSIVSSQSVLLEKSNNMFYPFFKDPEGKQYFRIAVYDFLRMVEIK